MNEPQPHSENRASPPPDYPARSGYLDEAVVSDYEQDRFSGLMGRFRFRQEQAGVQAMVGRLPEGLEILDVPCGKGRWWKTLEPHASRITALDISPTMLEAARGRVPDMSVEVTTAIGDAEAIDRPDNSFDAVFSHALTKHLPVPVQYKVLAEFARVSRTFVVCSFSLFGPVTYQLWRRRQFLDSYPLLPEQLDDMAGAAGLRVEARQRCSTPVGVEYSVLLKKTD